METKDTAKGQRNRGEKKEKKKRKNLEMDKGFVGA